MWRHLKYCLLLFTLAVLPCHAHNHQGTQLSQIEDELNSVSAAAVQATVKLKGMRRHLSGVLISSSGHILTLKNTLARGDTIDATLSTGQLFKAKVIKTWPFAGMALLKIPKDNCPFLPLGDSREIVVGDPVISVGNAFNSARGRSTKCAAHSGIISGRRTFKHSGIYFDGEAFLTDARINAGSEGGPLIDATGHLIAINGVPVVTQETYTNVSLALPLELVFDEIKKFGKVREQRSLFDAIQVDQKAWETGGVLILSVEKWAQMADLKKHDLIKRVGETDITNYQSFVKALSNQPNSRFIPLVIYRNGKFYKRWLPRQKQGYRTQLIGEAYRSAAKKAAKSLVKIHIERIGRSSEVDPNLPPDQQIFQLGKGPFSGVVYRSDGYILTSAFNLSGHIKKITVELSDGTILNARRLGTDLGRNITLLKVEAEDLNELQRVPFNEIQVGSTVLALGSTFENGMPTIDRGIVSALNRSAGKAVQIDANLTPGNFGGPSIDLKGRLIGINIPQAHQDATARQQATAGGQFSGSGIGFVIPMFDIDRIFYALKQSIVLEPAFLGIQFNSERELDGAEITTVIQEVGIAKKGVSMAQLRSVFHDQKAFKALHNLMPTGAAAAGLKSGDVILEFNGEPIPSWNVLLNSIGRMNAGDSVDFTIERDGKKRNVKAVLGPRGRVFY